VPRDHLSIGEVLGLLKEDFPDISISKIRFLESKGLLDPERTPSGYRKFYDNDVKRLRWILTQQRDNFLPLKVIKDRLESGDPDGVRSPPVQFRDGGGSDDGGRDEEPQVHATAAAIEPSPEEVTPGALDEAASSISMSADELASAAGLSEDDLRALEHLGIVQGRAVGPAVLYDENALAIARHAAACLRLGLEIRHLKVYLLAAQRESGFVEQVVTPLLTRQDPAARREARKQANALLELGDSLRGALLRQEVRSFLGPG